MGRKPNCFGNRHDEYLEQHSEKSDFPARLLQQSTAKPGREDSFQPPEDFPDTNQCDDFGWTPLAFDDPTRRGIDDFVDALPQPDQSATAEVIRRAEQNPHLPGISETFRLGDHGSTRLYSDL